MKKKESEVSEEHAIDCDVEKLGRMVFEARSLAARKGLLMHPCGGSSVRVTSFTLLPSPMPRRQFEEAFELGRILNRLVVAVAKDEKFLRDILRPSAVADPFLTRLLDLLDVNRFDSRILCTVNRYDFFVSASVDPEASKDKRGLRIVELNCTAAGAAMESEIVSGLHRQIATHPAAIDSGIALDPAALPTNNAIACVADALARAHKAFVSSLFLENEDVRAIMVVSPPYENICDQDSVRTLLLERYGIDMPRVPLCDIAEHGEVGDFGLLYLNNVVDAPRFVVSTAYFRCGYGPEDYGDPIAWAARALLEKSLAVCVPSVAMQLAGTKKVLQALSETDTLRRFISTNEAEQLSKTLVRQWHLSGEDGKEFVKRALEAVDDYVLKPQRDGGGNNLFKEDIRNVLNGASDDVLAQYILMERIHPRSVRNVVIREGSWEVAHVERELGVFGAALAVDGVLVENDARGHCTRSKLTGVDGGGICAGVAFMDSPRLVD